MTKSSIAVIVLNWNDARLLSKSVGSLLNQTKQCQVIVVDNGSTDNSRKVIESFGDNVVSIYNKRNLGFAGGVNTGIKYALKNNFKYIALLNNDAEADKNWVEMLYKTLGSNSKVAGVTSSLINPNNSRYDSTGEFYTVWGLPFPRGRGEAVNRQYGSEQSVMAVSGGASMFKTKFLKDVGLFDEDFFAYYEDIDLGLRGQLRGWEFWFEERAVAYHKTGTTSGRVKGFTTYQTIKNLPMLFVKNVPFSLWYKMLPRFMLAFWSFVLSAFARGDIIPVIKGLFMTTLFLPKKVVQRFHIQSKRTISSNEFLQKLTTDLPPQATRLRNLRRVYWKLSRRKV